MDDKTKTVHGNLELVDVIVLSLIGHQGIDVTTLKDTSGMGTEFAYERINELRILGYIVEELGAGHGISRVRMTEKGSQALNWYINSHLDLMRPILLEYGINIQ